MIELPKCSNGSIKAIYLVKTSDIVVKDGVVRLKRKYGKFKRKVEKFKVN